MYIPWPIGGTYLWAFLQFLQIGVGPGDLSIVLIPWGNWLRSHCIQWNSIWSLSALPNSEFGAAWMKSRMCNFKFSIPEWPLLLKCLHTSFLPSFLCMDVKWLPNLSIYILQSHAPHHAMMSDVPVFQTVCMGTGPHGVRKNTTVSVTSPLVIVV